MEARRIAVQDLNQMIEICVQNHVADLMRTNQVDKLKEVTKKFDFSSLHDFFKVPHIKLELGMSEIPDERCLELAFIINNSGYGDYKILDYYNLQDVLKREGGELGKRIEKKMHKNYLYELSIEELIS